MKSHHKALEKNTLKLFLYNKSIPGKPMKIWKKKIFQLEIYYHCRLIWFPCEKTMYWNQEQEHLTLGWRRSLYYKETRANRCTGFYMIGTSTVKELIRYFLNSKPLMNLFSKSLKNIQWWSPGYIGMSLWDFFCMKYVGDLFVILYSKK